MLFRSKYDHINIIMIEKKKYDLLSSKNIFGFERLPGCLFCWIPPPPIFCRFGCCSFPTAMAKPIYTSVTPTLSRCGRLRDTLYGGGLCTPRDLIGPAVDIPSAWRRLDYAFEQVCDGRDGGITILKVGSTHIVLDNHLCCSISRVRRPSYGLRIEVKNSWPYKG